MSDGQPPAQNPPKQLDAAAELIKQLGSNFLSVEDEKERDARLKREWIVLCLACVVVVVTLIVLAACVVAPMFGAAVPEGLQEKAMTGGSTLVGTLLGYAAGKKGS